MSIPRTHRFTGTLCPKTFWNTISSFFQCSSDIIMRFASRSDKSPQAVLLVRQQLSGYKIHSHTGTSFQRQPAFTIAITLLKCNELYTYLPQLDIEVAQLKRNETTFFRRHLGGNWFFDDTIGIQMREHPKILASRKRTVQPEKEYL